MARTYNTHLEALLVFNKLRFAAAVAVMCVMIRFAVRTAIEKALANSLDATNEFKFKSEEMKIPENRIEWNDNGSLLGNQSNSNWQNR